MGLGQDRVLLCHIIYKHRGMLWLGAGVGLHDENATVLNVNDLNIAP